MRLFGTQFELHSPIHPGGVLVKLGTEMSHGKTPNGGAGCGDPPGRRRRRVCRPCLGGLKVRTHCSKNQHEKVRYSLGGGGGRCLLVAHDSLALSSSTGTAPIVC